MTIALIAALSGLLGAFIAHLTMQVDSSSEFEIREFKKFTDSLGGKK